MISTRGCFQRWTTYLTTVASVLLLLGGNSWQPHPFMAEALTPNLPPLRSQKSGKTVESIGKAMKGNKPNQSSQRTFDKTNKKNDSSSSSNNTTTNNYHTSDFGAKQNHPSSYDPTPSFLGPIRLEPQTNHDGDDGTSQRSFHMGRERIQRYYQRHHIPMLANGRPLKPSSPTKQKLKAIVAHLAFHNAPVDVKEVCESIEFVLRTRKRLLGAAKQQQQKQRQGRNNTDATENTSIHLYDLCCGHGLTGMLFCCCHDATSFGGGDTSLNVILVDQTEPSSHAILRELLLQVCPWIGTIHNTISFREASLDSSTTLAGLGPSNKDFEESDTTITAITTNLVISTHACGSLTDRVLALASNSNENTSRRDDTDTPDDNHKAAAAVAVMPCCYTGTSQGAPFGIQRALGVAWAADIQRSYYLQLKGYHVDYTNIPREITPMNRILLGEYRGAIAP